ncbi:hypothetical protein VTO42DRAFT_1754 [Malbranchea cinnamomea]
MQPGDAEPAQPWLSDYHLVAYFSKKLNPAHRNYDTYDQELLAIVEAFRVWRHYLEGSTHPIQVQSEGAEALAAFDFLIEHKSGWCNPADALSRRLDYYSPTDKAQDGVGMLPTLQRKLKLGKWATCLCSGDPSSIEESTKHTKTGDSEPYIPRLLAIQATQDENAVELPAPRLQEIILKLQWGDASMLKVLYKVRLLLQVEFAYNNSVNSSTKVSPFFTLMCYNPSVISDPEPGNLDLQMDVMERHIKELDDIRANIADSLRGALDTQKSNYNAKYLPHSYYIGEWVLLNTKNIKTW